jgi:uncharacterized Zn-binding protein involved in type VI secretion
MTAHGTPLAGSGSTDVLIGGQPAWRAASDLHTCPLATGPQPHVGGVVAVGSSTVLVDGMPAARQGDMIAENGPPNTIISGDPTVLIGGGSTSADPPWVASLYERLASYVGEYNQAIDGREPGTVDGQLSTETVDFYVATDDGEAVFSFRTTEDTRIEEFQRGPREDATVRMETDEETVERMTDSGTPAREFRRRVIDGDIVIRGIGPVQAVRWQIINGLKHLWRAFGTV